MLLPVVGAGQVVVRVSAEIETESTTQTQERYDPEGQVVRNQTTTEDVSNSTEARSGGVAGISANVPDRNSGQPDQARPVNTTETTRKNHTTSYEINRTLTNTTRNPGSITMRASSKTVPRSATTASRSPRRPSQT